MRDIDQKDGQATGRECTKCGEWKVWVEFHVNTNGTMGRHSQCRECHNRNKRERRLLQPQTKTEKRAQLLKARYGLTPETYDELFASQDGRCAICDEEPARPCVDHDHDTGQTRGILCHYCNIRLPAVENEKYRLPAMAYLAKYAANDNQPPQEERQCAQITTMGCAS